MSEPESKGAPMAQPPELTILRNTVTMLEVQQDNALDEIRRLRAYLQSEKFHEVQLNEDTAVQLSDVLRRLRGVQETLT